MATKTFAPFTAPPTPQPYRFSVEQYAQMHEREIFAKWERGEIRTELLDGEIVRLAQISPWHANCADSMNEVLTGALPSDVKLRRRCYIQLDEHSLPCPDFAIVRADAEDDSQHPYLRPEDIHAVIEIADAATLERDRGAKLRAYARARIPEYWIVNLEAMRVDAWHNPEHPVYSQGRHRDCQTTVSLRSLSAKAKEYMVRDFFEGVLPPQFRGTFDAEREAAYERAIVQGEPQSEEPRGLMSRDEGA